MQRLLYLPLVLCCLLNAEEAPKAPTAHASVPSMEKLTQWVSDLGNDDFTIREAADKNLKLNSTLAIPFLKAALPKASDLEHKKRIEWMLNLYDGTGPEVNGLCVKLILKKAVVAIGEKAEFNVLYLNRTEKPLILCLGYKGGVIQLVQIEEDKELPVKSSGGRGSLGNAAGPRPSYIEIPAQSVYQQSLKIWVQDEALSKSHAEQDNHLGIGSGADIEPHIVLPAAGTYRIRMLTHKNLLRVKSGDNEITYTGPQGPFQSSADQWAGQARSNEVELTLKSADAKP